MAVSPTTEVWNPPKESSLEGIELNVLNRIYQNSAKSKRQCGSTQWPSFWPINLSQSENRPMLTAKSRTSAPHLSSASNRMTSDDLWSPSFAQLRRDLRQIRKDLKILAEQHCFLIYMIYLYDIISYLYHMISWKPIVPWFFVTGKLWAFEPFQVGLPLGLEADNMLQLVNVF